MTKDKQAAESEVRTDKNPANIPASENPSRNSQLYNEMRNQDAVSPEDYPEKDRVAGNAAVSDADPE
ncbi:hypothetical protein [Croceicoccus mobilis]|uniref:Uncharacterized protein n=1 Tax=Croceicoccus mobilis TaxID=1703339 RepID=A0A916ZA71_9SPHN|nr:hypothetical protein [Croceicoccus mobilis]GGD83804.1 hypothetical protein GCM10010990_37390 [Croceicoccus mobilis]